MKKDKQKIIALYDECDCTDSEVEYRMEEKQNILKDELAKAKKVWKRIQKGIAETPQDKWLLELKRNFEREGKPCDNKLEFLQGYLDDSEIGDLITTKTGRGGERIVIDEDKVREQVYEDSDIYTWHYDDFIQNLDEGMKEYMKKGGYWRVDGHNMGWQNRTGYRHFQAENGEELFQAIKPNTSELTAYFYEGKGGMEARISHHDSPTGEYYKITAITEKTYNKHN